MKQSEQADDRPAPSPGIRQQEPEPKSCETGQEEYDDADDAVEREVRLEELLRVVTKVQEPLHQAYLTETGEHHKNDKGENDGLEGLSAQDFVAAEHDSENDAGNATSVAADEGVEE